MTSVREINILLGLDHPNILNVSEVVVGKSLDSIFLVMEFMEHDLKGLLEELRQPFSTAEVKALMRQLEAGKNKAVLDLLDIQRQVSVERRDRSKIISVRKLETHNAKLCALDSLPVGASHSDK